MKKLGIILAALLLCGTSMLPVSATSETHLTHVVDEADLLSLDEESRLENELDEMSERLEFDVVVVTVDCK